MSEAEIVEPIADSALERSVEQDMFNDAIKVNLGGRMFAVAELPNRKSREWKKKFKVIIDRIRAGAGSTDSTTAQATMDYMFFEADQEFLDLILDYAPTIKAEEEWVRDNATDNQILDGARRIIHLALPFVWRGGELLTNPQ